jgi:ethanolamine-phosphate cytidylyltransferase
LFHLGHIELLRKAKELGDFVIVGVHDDATVNGYQGSNHPVMNLHERVLSVLACRYVDEVIIGAPYVVTKDVLEKVYDIDVVVGYKETSLTKIDPYTLPKERGIYKEVELERKDYSTDTIVERIVKNRALYEARNKRKLEKAALEDEMKNATKKKAVS